MSNLWPNNESAYIVIFSHVFLNFIYNNQWLDENQTLASYKWHSDNINPVEMAVLIFLAKELSCFSIGIWEENIIAQKKGIVSGTHCYRLKE